MEKIKFSWSNTQDLDDDTITYLLYKEGKSLELIGRIRNISLNEVKKQLVNAKARLRSRKKEEKKLLDYLLEMSKTQRQKIIVNLSKEEKKSLAKDIYISYPNIKNYDDKLTLIWIVGELGVKKLLPLIYGEINHPFVNIRRVTCSAMGKLKYEKSKPYLMKFLRDSNPQVRQYAVKALGHIGDEKSKEILNEILRNPKEKAYVKRAILESVQEIDKRVIKK
ncbi:MAG: HEAT repeat domain-containing protein [Anaeromicrobium sp.]|jgi:DNA-binding CsgD family transcriptional regulator|uniref:HEAT repeat domain-containing protein n=1 Tax=Anaeromicrobium sp. TaxID=1929132 RepID=UPI0025EA1764|nr:HEAT repeat domain-containing protein [Anaeromicrobium sp.]MCT4593382.1 HEAT repeat domain-containing protein [Anaeromicrobium sp.]